MIETDLIVVGSGPAGANAAKQAIEEGLSVTLVDFGNDEPALADAIPRKSFSELRRSDSSQRAYFVGEAFAGETSRNDRLGSHFTAPRDYIVKDVAGLLPIESDTFFPVQSLALGGLGVGWGAGCQVYESFELERAGLPVAEMSAYYDAVVRDIGVSGAREDDTAAQVLAPGYLQPPTDIDTNATLILEAYARRRADLRAAGFNLGRDPLAMLTEPLVRPGITRSANPYTDMDFYGHADYSIYRPKYTVIELQQHPKFRYVRGALVQVFAESDEGVTISFVDRSRQRHELRARKLLLAAGALNSARIALRSRGMYDVRTPVLSNRMHYMPCVNLRMLGRSAVDRRHSLGQLLAVFTPRHRAPEHVIAGVISYRSLLHYRIVRQMPLPVSLGLLVSRVLMTSLTMVGVHHPESPSAEKWISLRRRGDDDTLAANYVSSAAEHALMRADLRALVTCLRKLSCFPLAIFSTVPGASIHYAGPVPMTAEATADSLSADARGKLHGNRHVFIADSATWRYLPAKGPTLTLMANARRVAHEAAAELLTAVR